MIPGSFKDKLVLKETFNTSSNQLKYVGTITKLLPVIYACTYVNLQSSLK